MSPINEEELFWKCVFNDVINSITNGFNRNSEENDIDEEWTFSASALWNDRNEVQMQATSCYGCGEYIDCGTTYIPSCIRCFCENPFSQFF